MQKSNFAVSRVDNCHPVVPLNDLRRHTLAMQEEIEEVIATVVTSGWYVLGPNVAAFEEEFAAYCGTRHCIGVGNGTDALELALRAVGCGRDTEVVTVANAGMYATSAINAVGARPVFADIDPVTMTMSPESLDRCIGPLTRAVVVTHLYGRLADMSSLLSTAERHRGIAVIEDCAQAHGAERSGHKAGSVGSIGCFSFYPTKNLGALGDAGALTTNNDEHATTLKRLRQYGWRSKYDADRPFGRNSRLDELQAAVLRTKLPKLGGWNARRREIIARYRRAANPSLIVPDAADCAHAAHLCVVRSDDRVGLRTFLEARKIATDIHYPIPDHHQQAMREVAMSGLSLPHTGIAVGEILTVPCFPEMTESEIERVSEALAVFEPRPNSPRADKPN